MFMLSEKNTDFEVEMGLGSGPSSDVSQLRDF